jgi:hypothetical protein
VYVYLINSMHIFTAKWKNCECCMIFIYLY